MSKKGGKKGVALCRAEDGTFLPPAKCAVGRVNRAISKPAERLVVRPTSAMLKQARDYTYRTTMTTKPTSCVLTGPARGSDKQKRRRDHGVRCSNGLVGALDINGATAAQAQALRFTLRNADRRIKWPKRMHNYAGAQD